MILAIYASDKSAALFAIIRSKRRQPVLRLDWLRESYPYAVRDHALWISNDHRAGHTGLARYFDFGDGPVPEISDSPDYYRGAAEYFARHREEATGLLVSPESPDAIGPVFNVSPCSPPPNTEETPASQPFTAI